MYKLTLLLTGDEEYFPTAALVFTLFGSILGEKETNALISNDNDRRRLKEFEDGKRNTFQYHSILIERIVW